MKSINVFRKVLIAILILTGDQSSAQIQLSFTGKPGKTGKAGNVGTVYTWNDVGTTGNTTIKATIEILDITGGAKLEKIDNTSSGSTNAWQPVINGSQSDGSCFGIEFKVSFFDASNDTALTLSSFNAAGVDIDGNGGTLREFNRFDGIYSYSIENNTLLDTSSTDDKFTFTSPQSVENGIDYRKTRYIAVAAYRNVSSFTLKLGSCCVGGNCFGSNGNRLHSVNMYDAIPFNSARSLPVSLLYFEAEASNGNKVDLSWATASEDNNDYFTIEKSDNGRDWVVVNTVEGAGTSSTIMNYTYTDVHAEGDVVYYRLKQTDFDGKFEYFPVRRVERNRTTTSARIYPNPAKNSLNVKRQSRTGESAELQIVRLNGDVVISELLISNQSTINIMNLPNGVYFVKVIGTQQVEQFRFIKN